MTAQLALLLSLVLLLSLTLSGEGSRRARR